MRQVLPAAVAAIIAALSISPAAAFNEAGIASIYGPNDAGGRFGPTGKRIDHQALTAAHKTLPLGTLVEVVNKRNGRHAVIKITDRGPYVRGRIIDLTAASAKALGVDGLDPVRIGIAPAHGCTFAERYGAGLTSGHMRAHGREGCPLETRDVQVSSARPIRTASLADDGAAIASLRDDAWIEPQEDDAMAEAFQGEAPSFAEPVQYVDRSPELSMRWGALTLLAMMISALVALTWLRSLRELPLRAAA